MMVKKNIEHRGTCMRIVQSRSLRCKLHGKPGKWESDARGASTAAIHVLWTRGWQFWTAAAKAVFCIFRLRYYGGREDQDEKKTGSIFCPEKKDQSIGKTTQIKTKRDIDLSLGQLCVFVSVCMLNCSSNTACTAFLPSS